MSSMFNAPHFQSVETAREYLEALRWGADRVCRIVGPSTASFATKKPGVYRCNSKECRKDFSVTTRPSWRAAISLTQVAAGILPHVLQQEGHHRPSASSHASASPTRRRGSWRHRIREAMRDWRLAAPSAARAKLWKPTKPITANSKSACQISDVASIQQAQARAKSLDACRTRRYVPRQLPRDGCRRWPALLQDHPRRTCTAKAALDDRRKPGSTSRRRSSICQRMKPSSTAATNMLRGDVITTNTVEGYYSIFKRGMKGVYQHCDEKHLHRYLAEFDFRYNNRVALASTMGTGGRWPSRVRLESASRIVNLTSAI